MALKFNIKSTQDCGKLKYTNCSDYCDINNYKYNFLIASIKPNVVLLGNSLQVTTDILASTDKLNTVTWSVNGGNPIISSNHNTVNGIIEFTQVLPGLVSGVNIIVMTVVDGGNNVSTLTFTLKISSLSGKNFIESLAIPELSINTNNSLSVQFNDSSILTNTTIDSNSITFIPDGVSILNSVINFSYPVVNTYNLNYQFIESNTNELISLTGIIDIVNINTNCVDQLTITDISSVTLKAISPKGDIYSFDITNNFINLTSFIINISDLTNLDIFESGIWTFQTIVNKITINGSFIFSESMQLVIICKEECAFNNYIVNYTLEELNCCNNCKNEKEKKIILIQIYIDAIKNASACGDSEKITKFINLLQRLISNKNCKC